MWLGKRKIAIHAFENSLALKPYFKEALNGLDQAQGKGYIYTINDTSARYNYGMPIPGSKYVYPIDRYYHILKRKPSDVPVRVKLLKALYKVNRLEEAKRQIQILSRTSIDTTKKFQQLSNKILQYRQKFYNKKIKYYQAKLKRNPSNRDLILKIGDYYTNLEDYNNALSIYKNYLKLKPNNSEIIYRYAKVSAWNHDFQTSISKMDELLKIDPNNLKYQLLRAQLAIWTGHDLKLAKTYLNNYLKKYPKNINAIVAMGSLYIQEQRFSTAKKYLNLALHMNSTYPDVMQLQSDYDFQKLRAEQEKLFAILQQGRKLALNGDCEAALSKYNEYLAKAEPNRLIRKEYADVNACAKNYDKAIKIYDELLSKQYDYKIALQRAKVYYWMSDSVQALSAFQKLTKEKPNDFIADLYLGDSYTKMHKYDSARTVYNDLLKTNLDSSQIAMVNQRKGWLPVTGFKGFIESFPNYVLLSPFGSFYGDNLSFRYNTQGISLNFGVTAFLSLGVQASRSTLAANGIITNLNAVRWNINFTLAKHLSLGGNFGSEY